VSVWQDYLALHKTVLLFAPVRNDISRSVMAADQPAANAAVAGMHAKRI